MEPPIHTEYLRSGGATTLIFIVEGARAVSSLVVYVVDIYTAIGMAITLPNVISAQKTAAINAAWLSDEVIPCFRAKVGAQPPNPVSAPT